MEVSKLQVTLGADASGFRASFAAASGAASAAMEAVVTSASSAAAAATAVDHALAGIHAPSLGGVATGLNQAAAAAEAMHQAIEHAVPTDLGPRLSASFGQATDGASRIKTALGGVDQAAAAINLTPLTTGFGAAGEAASHARIAFGQAAEASHAAAEGTGSAGQAARGAGSAFSSATGGVTAMGIALAQVAANAITDMLERAASAVLGLGRNAIQLAGELEQSKIAFTTLLGSEQKADAFLRDLTTFAANTPFELKGLQESSKKLLAFGFDARDIIPIMRSVGDATAALGGGKQMIDGITLAIGQMSAKGKVSAEEMNQLAERGVPAWKLVADAIGKDIPTAMKMAEKGAIDSSTAINALVTGMESKFGGLMEKQSKTFLGAMSNLGDGTEQVLTRIGQKVLQALPLTEIVSTAGTAMSRLADIIEKAPIPSFDKLGDIMRGVFADPTIEAGILGIGTALAVAVAPAAAEAAASLVAMGIAGVEAFVAMSAAAFPYVALAAAVAFAAKPIIENWGALPGAFGAYFSLIESVATEWYQGLRTIAKQVQDAFHAVAANISNFFKPVFDWLGNTFQKAFDLLPDSAKGAVSSLANLFNGAKASVGGAIESIPGMVSAKLGPIAGSIAGTARSWASSAASGMQGVADGISGAFSSVGTLWNKLTGESDKAMDALGKNSQLHLGKANKALDDHAKAHKKAADAAAKAAKQITAGFEDIAQHIMALDEKAKGMDFSQLEYATKYVEILGSGLDALFNKGVTAKDPRMAALIQEFEEAGAALADLKKIDELVQAPIKGMQKLAEAGDKVMAAFNEMAVSQAVLGEDFDETAELIKINEMALRALVDDGLKPTEQDFKDLVAATKALKQEAAIDKVMGDAARSMREAADTAQNLGERFDDNAAMADFAKTVLAGLAKQHITTGDEVELFKAIVEDCTTGLDRYRESAGKLQNALGGLLGAVKTLAGGLGAGFTTPLLDGISNLMAMASAAGEVGKGFTETGPKLTDFLLNLQANTPAMLDFATHLDTTIPEAAKAFSAYMDGTLLPTLQGLGQVLQAGIGPAFKGLSTAIGDVVAAGGPLGTVLGFILNPITGITAAITGLVVAGTALINNWDTIKNVALGFFQSIADWAGKSMQFVINNVHDAWERILNFFTGGVHKMDLWVDAAKEQEFQTQKVTKALVEQIEFVDKLGASMMQALGNGGSAMKAFLDGSKGMAASLRDNVKDAIIGGIVDAMARQKVIENAFGGLMDDLGRAMANGNTSLASSLIQQIGSKVPQVAATLEGMLGPLKDALKDAFSGGAAAIGDIQDATSKAMQAQDFAASIGGKDDGAGTASDLTARANILKKALTDLNEAGEAGSSVFQDYKAQLDQVSVALDKAKASAKDDKADTKAMGSLADAAYGNKLAALQGQLAKVMDNGKGPGSSDYDAIYAQITQTQAELAAAKASGTPKLAKGGLATGATMAMIGEGADHEAVLPLNASVYSQMAQGIVKALPAPAPGGGRSGDSYTLVVQYMGKGRWTKQDATELGDLLVGQVRQKLGVRL